MEVNLAVLADAANVSREGKLNITGIFDRFSFQEFPATSPSFMIVLRFQAHPNEAGKHKLLMRLADADGQEVSKLEGEFVVPGKRTGGKPVNGQIILGAQVRLPHPGDYSFDILIDGRWERSIPLEVQKIST